MKRIVSSILLLSLFILTGCSSTTKEETRTIETVKGKIEIPNDPQRVVVDYFVGDVLALGVEPVGTTYVYEGSVFEDELKDVPSINGDDAYGQYSMEAVTKLKPDLIITYSEADYDNLSKIAPTVLVDYLNMTTAQRVTWMADVLNKKEEGKKLLNEFNQEVISYKQQLQDAKISNQTITLMETYSKELFVYGNKQGRGGEVLYDLLELKAPGIVQKEIINGEQYRSISLEAINEYTGDIVMIGGWQEDPMDLVGDNSIWNSTLAVKNKKVITYDSSAYIYQDILSTKEQLKNITQSILALYE